MNGAAGTLPVLSPPGQDRPAALKRDRAGATHSYSGAVPATPCRARGRRNQDGPLLRQGSPMEPAPGTANAPRKPPPARSGTEETGACPCSQQPGTR